MECRIVTSPNRHVIMQHSLRSAEQNKSTVAKQGLDDQEILVRFMAEKSNFVLSHTVQTHSGSTQPFSQLVPGTTFPRVKRPDREAGHLSFQFRGQEWVELCLHPNMSHSLHRYIALNYNIAFCPSTDRMVSGLCIFNGWGLESENIRGV
jgi:hypothetical protein